MRRSPEFVSSTIDTDQTSILAAVVSRDIETAIPKRAVDLVLYPTRSLVRSRQAWLISSACIAAFVAIDIFRSNACI